MEQLGEWLTRIGMLWVNGFIVIIAAAVQAGPFLLAGGGITVFTLLFIEWDHSRRRKKRRGAGQEPSAVTDPKDPGFTVR